VDSRGLGSEIALLPNAEKADQARPATQASRGGTVVIDSDDELLEQLKAADRRVSLRRRERPLTEHLRHTPGMASQPSFSDRFSVAELTVRSAQSDLLEVDPLDFGPDAPATAALEVERGPEPRDMRQRGD
jgi:hypothetical protein